MTCKDFDSTSPLSYYKTDQQNFQLDFNATANPDMWH